MKNNIVVIILLLLMQHISGQNETGLFTDNRDGKVYKKVRIGNQWWMAENLNIGKMVLGKPSGNYQFNNNIIEKYCYNDDTANCTVYGGLYDWDEMMNYSLSSNILYDTVQGICPTGWHVPSDKEWQTMEITLGMTAEQVNGINLRGSHSGKIKESGSTHWQSDNIADNSSGFTALPGGSRFDWAKRYGNINVMANFWTSSDTFVEYGTMRTGISRYIYSSLIEIGRDVAVGRKSGLAHSLRCVEDSPDFTSVKNKLVDPEITISPNPSRGIFNIWLRNSGIQFYQIEISNMCGTRVYLMPVNKKSYFNIDISAQAKGVYVVRTFSSSGIITRKIILQ